MTTPHESPAPAGGSPRCSCPETPEWEHYHSEGCPKYTSCGGWTWDPPCGGCDYCLQMHDEYYEWLRTNGEG